MTGENLQQFLDLTVLEGAGITVGQVSVSHVDKGFVYAGDGDYGQLLLEEDVTEQVRALLPGVPVWLATVTDDLRGVTFDLRNRDG